MSRPLATLAISALVALSLGGCDDTKRALGFEKRTPDEFRVVSRAPLDVPPEFGLRPPQPGAARPNEPTARDLARTAVFGGEKQKPQTRIQGRSTAETALLRAAGAENADPAIRGIVNRETSQLADADGSLVDQLLFWREPTPPGTPIDAEREAQRLRETAALGKKPTEGEVPVIERRRRGLLDGLF